MKTHYILNLYDKEDNTELLLGFPFSGAIAQVFNIFKNDLLENVSLAAIQYPGRGGLISESLIYDIDDMINLLYEEILDCIKKYKKVYFYGHSLGGLVAYELLSALHRTKVNIEHCILNIGACPGPDLIGKRDHLHKLSDNDFWQKINLYGGTPAAIIQDDEFRELFLPIIKADFTIYETYSYKTSSKTILPIAINAFGGDKDAIIKFSDLDSWKNYTTLDYKQICLSGDHFFLNNNSKYIVEKMTNYSVLTIS